MLFDDLLRSLHHHLAVGSAHLLSGLLGHSHHAVRVLSARLSAALTVVEHEWRVPTLRRSSLHVRLLHVHWKRELRRSSSPLSFVLRQSVVVVILRSGKRRSTTVLLVLWVQTICTHVLVFKRIRTTFMSIVEWVTILDGLLLLLPFLFRFLLLITRVGRAVFLLFLLPVV